MLTYLPNIIQNEIIIDSWSLKKGNSCVWHIQPPKPTSILAYFSPLLDERGSSKLTLQVYLRRQTCEPTGDQAALSGTLGMGTGWTYRLLQQRYIKSNCTWDILHTTWVPFLMSVESRAGSKKNASNELLLAKWNFHVIIQLWIFNNSIS